MILSTRGNSLLTGFSASSQKAARKILFQQKSDPVFLYYKPLRTCKLSEGPPRLSNLPHFLSDLIPFFSPSSPGPSHVASALLLEHAKWAQPQDLCTYKCRCLKPSSRHSIFIALFSPPSDPLLRVEMEVSALPGALITSDNWLLYLFLCQFSLCPLRRECHLPKGTGIFQLCVCIANT